MPSNSGIVSAAVVIIVGEEALVIRRSSTAPWGALLYDLPGGTMDDEETPEQAAKREVMEEAGIKVDKLYELGVFGQSRSMMFFVAVLDEKPNVTLSFEHDKMKWVDLNKAIPNDVLNRVKQALFAAKDWMTKRVVGLALLKASYILEKLQ